jgi:hypothetical protein
MVTVTGEPFPVENSLSWEQDQQWERHAEDRAMPKVPYRPSHNGLQNPVIIEVASMSYFGRD